MAEQERIRPGGPGWRVRQGEGFTLHLDAPGDAHLAFAAAVARGLDARPRRLEPRFIYDAQGSALYEAITEQPEYYPTRTEDAILSSCADALAARVGSTTLVELGSGSSTKTRHLIEAWRARGEVSYVPIDVSATAVAGAAVDLRERYPGLSVEGIASTFQRGLPLVARLHPKTLLFLGSTLGNFEPDEVAAFFRQVSGVLAEGDFFVLGIDLVKDPAVLEAAYADAAGVTERFILNVFARMNRELGSHLVPDAFCMDSFYDVERQRVEMWARARHRQRVDIAPLGRRYTIAAGERILVEVSRKFTVGHVEQEAARFQLWVDDVFTDPDGYFAVLLLRRGARRAGWSPTTVSGAPSPRRPEVPPVGAWRVVPAGSALLGEPAVPRPVAGVQLGATPVTCAEYRAFVEAGGYTDAALWSDEGLRFIQEHRITAPLGWELRSGRWGIGGGPLDHLRPVTGLTFHEAEAFACWAGARLPTEAEWEKAVSWDPEHGRRRSWPWGELPPDPRRVNAGGSLSGPVAVGSYPGSVSFYGLHQALGDVWEWVRGEEGPVLRGGSWQTALPELTNMLRRSASGAHRDATVGLRLARGMEEA